SVQMHLPNRNASIQTFTVQLNFVQGINKNTVHLYLIGKVIVEVCSVVRHVCEINPNGIYSVSSGSFGVIVSSWLTFFHGVAFTAIIIIKSVISLFNTDASLS
ncbi:hypothetical protein CSKR_201126, partial [Clonorchis sinensis]